MERIDVSKIVNRILRTAGHVTSGALASEAGISRQAAHAHLARRVETGELRVEGAARRTRYVRPRGELRRRFDRAGLAEDRVWAELEAQVRRMVGSEAAFSAVRYAFQEMVNNAIEHSGSSKIEVVFERTRAGVAFEVIDRGVGIFEKVRSAIGLANAFEAVQELSKGKLTTAPAHHSGEGVFFSSKVASRFEVESGEVLWRVDARRDDHAVASVRRRNGTRVRFDRDDGDDRTIESVFRQYAEDFVFDKTRIVVSLFELGTPFVSRSEARRMLDRLTEFREVVLDFHRVDGIGQGFADEVFRVWATAHPAITLVPVRMNEAVTFMVERARRAPASRR